MGEAEEEGEREKEEMEREKETNTGCDEGPSTGKKELLYCYASRLCRPVDHIYRSN